MTEYHAGRLVDHVHIRVSDLEASKRFYSAVLESLGLGLTWEGDGAFAVFRMNTINPLFVGFVRGFRGQAVD